MALLAHVQEPARAAGESRARPCCITDGGKERAVDDDGVIQLADDDEPRLLLVATVLAHSASCSRATRCSSPKCSIQACRLVADLQVNGKARLSIPAVMRMVGRRARRRATA